MAINNIPERHAWGGLRPKIKAGELVMELEQRQTEPPPPKVKRKRGQPKPPKRLPKLEVAVRSLLEEMRRTGATIIRTRARHQLSTTGRPISLEVVNAALYSNRIRGVGQPLFPDSSAPILARQYEVADGQ